MLDGVSGTVLGLLVCYLIRYPALSLAGVHYCKLNRCFFGRIDRMQFILHAKPFFHGCWVIHQCVVYGIYCACMKSIKTPFSTVVSHCQATRTAT